MKKWVIPQVRVQKFVANEYIGTCTPIPIPQFNKSGRTYVDWNKDQQIESGHEDIYNYNASTGSYSIAPVTRGYYNNVKLYKVNPASGGTILYGGSYDVDATAYNSVTEQTVNLFIYLGEFDVHVNSQYNVVFYPSSQWDDSGVPAKEFS